MGKILWVQLALIVTAAALVLLAGTWPALSTLYGGAIALGNSLLIARRIVQARRALDRDPNADVISLYVGAAERLTFTLAAMAAGMGWLRLDPPYLLLGFAVAYLAHPLGKTFLDAGGSHPGGNQ